MYTIHEIMRVKSILSRYFCNYNKKISNNNSVNGNSVKIGNIII